MTCIQISTTKVRAVLCTTEAFLPGDPAPEGYLAWHEWAEVQHKSGLRQKACGRCGKWRYPQELSDLHDRAQMQSRKGPVTLMTPVCVSCAEPKKEEKT